MNYHFVKKSANSKTGPIPVTYSERGTCPTSCPHINADCYGEDYYTSMVWNKVNERGGDITALAANIQALPDGQLWRMNVVGDLPGENETVDAVALGAIVKANIGKLGYTYTHKHSSEAMHWIKHANDWGFTINLSADDVNHADQLAALRVGPVCVIVPMDTPKHSQTPDGRAIVICPAQTSEEVTCASCKLCARKDRAVIVGFRAHGSKAKKMTFKSIPIVKG